MTTITPKNAGEWRAWLQKNHALAPGYQNLHRRFVAEAKQAATRWLLAALKNPWGASRS